MACVTWGTLPVIVQHARAPAPVLVAMRMGFGAAALGLALPLAGRDLRPRGHLAMLCGLGLLLAAQWVVFFYGLRLLPGATATLVLYSFPILVALAAPPLLHEPRERHVLGFAVLGFAGIAALLAPRIGAGGGAGDVVVALAGPITQAALVIGARRAVANLEGPVVAFWQYATGAVALLPWALAGGRAPPPWAWGALIGVVHTAGAGLLFFYAVARLSAPQAAVLMYLEPLSAVGFVWAASGQTPPAWTAIGALAVLGAGAGLVGLSAGGRRGA